MDKKWIILLAIVLGIELIISIWLKYRKKKPKSAPPRKEYLRAEADLRYALQWQTAAAKRGQALAAASSAQGRAADTLFWQAYAESCHQQAKATETTLNALGGETVGAVLEADLTDTPLTPEHEAQRLRQEAPRFTDMETRAICDVCKPARKLFHQLVINANNAADRIDGLAGVAAEASPHQYRLCDQCGCLRDEEAFLFCPACANPNFKFTDFRPSCPQPHNPQKST